MASARVGTMFHESFSLSRPALSDVLAVAIETAGDRENKSRESRFDTLREKTNLGRNYVKAMPRYANGTGLVDKGFVPSKLGHEVWQRDPLLSMRATQWLMHYHLSAPGGPGPAFWHHLVKEFFISGREFSSAEILDAISTFHVQSEGKGLAEKSARATTTVFLGSYVKSDGLGSLSILEDLGGSRYRVNDDLDPPPTWVVAYAIIDFWKKCFQDQASINLDELTNVNGVANVFMIGAGRVASILQKMQLEGFVDLYRVAPPYQVVLLRPDLEAILEKVYAND